MPPLTTPTPVRSLYVHVPFCHTICGYCDFYSEVLDRDAAGPLVDALLAELESYHRTVELLPETIFVGGGTPTTLPTGPLSRLFSRLRNLCGDRPDVEFTSEANPATVSPETARILADCGVNRISIGAQSFDSAELKVLERIHHPAQVEQTVAAARAAGIQRVNLDLIFGVPGQTLSGWQRNLQAAIALRPDHLSCYGLTYERGTPLYEQLHAGRVERVAEDSEAEMFEATIDMLAAAGYEQYEISNYARPGCECRHNLRYWHNEPSLGIGPSAAGLIGETRYRNVPDTAEYVRAIRAGRSPRIEQETLSPDHRARETAMLMLRLKAGIDRQRFAARFGSDPAQLFAGAIERNREGGLIEVTPEAVRLTRRGLLVADSVVTDFL